MFVKILLIITSLIVVGVVSVFILGKVEPTLNVFQTPLPSPVAYDEARKNTPTPKPAATTDVDEVNLGIPFVAQAPFGNWSEPYQNFCEEASVLMAMSYIKGQNVSDPAVADSKLLAIKAFEDQRFGDYRDTTAAETATIIKEFYKYPNAVVVHDPSVEDIKKALSAGKAVIVPLAGQRLGNPYYTQPGPLYHMLVIKGYTKDGKFITNDPGTRHGANYVYPAEVIMNAIHDWNGGNVYEGGKVIIIVG